MLTADLVGARRRGATLRLIPTDAARRAHVEALADAYTAIARAHVDRTRAELDAALDDAAAGASGDERVSGSSKAPSQGDRRLGLAVRKLIVDACRFEDSAPADAISLRREVFRAAAAARRDATAAAPFDRAAILDAVARARDGTGGAVEAALFADRPGAQRLLAVESPPPTAIAAGFALAEAQAVLLRATKVEALVRAADAATYRHLFRTLKFLRLLPVIAPAPDGGYRVELDGPLSLFEGSTRYGVKLGLALPAIAACGAWSIEADVRWGRDRCPLRFRVASGKDVDRPDALPAPAPPDELTALVTAFEALDSGWRIEHEPAILDLPGAGLCVPDLAFVRARDGCRVYFELLGFWSRDAVWRRVDLARAGLPHRILFAASRRLRVGEAVLDDTAHAALYVFARVPNARAILDHVETLAA